MANPGQRTMAKNTPLQKWLRIHPDQKPKAYAQVYGSAEMPSLSYWLEIVFSAGIAAFGLVLNSPAVIIGAMPISPPMGPIMAMGLALAAAIFILPSRRSPIWPGAFPCQLRFQSLSCGCCHFIH